MPVPESIGHLRLYAACVAAASLLALAGCGGLSETEEVARADAEAARQELEELRRGADGGWSSLRLSRRPWLAIERIGRTSREALPPGLTDEGAVTLPLGDVRDDAVLAARIEAAAEIGVRFAGPPSGGGAASVRGGRARRGAGASGDFRLASFAAALRDGWMPAGGLWTGPLDRLLDAWCEAAGYEWRVADGGVLVVRRRTVTFAINALSGSQEYRARTSSQDSVSGQGTAGSASQSISSSSTFSPWPEIVEQVTRLGGDGAVIGVSASNGSVTMSARPASIARVRAYLRHLNREILRPLTVSAHVYSVRFDRAADYEVGISGLIEKLFGARFAIEVGSGRIAIVRPRQRAESGGYAVSATVRALQTLGSASRVLSADIPSLNGKPAQFYELLNTAYLKEVKTSSTESGTQTTLTPGEVRSGFSLSYTARITAPDEVLVRLVASLRDRPQFAVFGSGGAQIQLPVYGDRGVQATQRLRRGEALVVSGFSDRSSLAEGSGTFDPSVPAPEGRRRASASRNEQVLLLTVDIGEPLGISETAGTEL